MSACTKLSTEQTANSCLKNIIVVLENVSLVLILVNILVIILLVMSEYFLTQGHTIATLLNNDQTQTPPPYNEFKQ